jgi:hypothetical protein
MTPMSTAAASPAGASVQYSNLIAVGRRRARLANERADLSAVAGRATSEPGSHRAARRHSVRIAVGAV